MSKIIRNKNELITGRHYHTWDKNGTYLLRCALSDGLISLLSGVRVSFDKFAIVQLAELPDEPPIPEVREDGWYPVVGGTVALYPLISGRWMEINRDGRPSHMPCYNQDPEWVGERLCDIGDEPWLK